MEGQPDASSTRRRYSSPRRRQHAADTRAAVLDAATRLFAERGWNATGMRDVAHGAGVAVETVYANFGSKGELLKAALDLAVAGDTAPVPLADRPEFAAVGRGPLRDRAAVAAQLVYAIHERTYGIRNALREGAATDHELEKRVADLEERRRVNVEQAGSLIAGRPITATERDGLWAVVSMEVYQLLVDRAGWSRGRYQDWLADTIVRLLRTSRKERS